MNRRPRGDAERTSWVLAELRSSFTARNGGVVQCRAQNAAVRARIQRFFERKIVGGDANQSWHRSLSTLRERYLGAPEL